MAEEEDGFTFVDKRRTTGAEDEAPVTGPEAARDDVQAAADEPSPSVYELTGYCISLLATEAWQKLGLIAHPGSGQATADLIQAKFAIDAVGDLTARLDSAPIETVPESLRRDLRTLLNDLRLNYIAQRGDAGTSRN